MQYCSTMIFTATGGRSLSRGFTPSRASSSLWRTSHLWKVFIETPAAAASWLLLIAFISVSIILMNFQVIFIGRWRYLRLPSKIPSSAIEVESENIAQMVPLPPRTVPSGRYSGTIWAIFSDSNRYFQCETKEGTHTITLTGLPSETVFWYRAYATDETGFYMDSNHGEFTTY